MPPTNARRVVFPAFREAAWEDVPLAAPDALGPHEVLYRAVCSMVSAGTELGVFAGTHIGFRTPGATYPRIPFRPGYVSAGVVEAVGSDVLDVRPGDRVSVGARHEDWAVVDTLRRPLLRLPDEVTFEQACVARLAQISMQGVRLARIQLGERVAVFGQGLIGQLARQIAAIDGAATTIAVDLADSRLEIARNHGATHTFNPGRENLTDAVAAATVGHGVDVAIEATGQPKVINDALRVAADLGRVILLGSPRSHTEIDVYYDIHRKGVALIGAHGRTSDVEANPYHRWTTEEHHRLTVELIRQGRLRTDGLVTDRVSAGEALSVFPMLLEQPDKHLGAVIEWSR
jgi:threonine dehydrogenase-like Zn-dependent dehydrogenase